VARGGFSEAEFLEHLQRAAVEKAADKNCRKCGKATSPKHTRCMHCGEPPDRTLRVESQVIKS
jgi:uncharacterized OB-fold protein